MRKLILLCLVALFCLPIAAYAASIGGAETLKKHSWELGPEISYIKYEEPDLMEEKGAMFGLNGSYTPCSALFRRFLPLN